MNSAASSKITANADKEKPNPKRKFHAFCDKIYRPDILKTEWLKVKSNNGSAGIDGITIDKIVNEIGESQYLNELYRKLKTQTYRPQPVRRVWIPKVNSEKMRLLDIPKEYRKAV